MVFAVTLGVAEGAGVAAPAWAAVPGYERLSKEDQRKVRTGMEKLLPLLRAAAEESTDA